MYQYSILFYPDGVIEEPKQLLDVVNYPVGTYVYAVWKTQAQWCQCSETDGIAIKYWDYISEDEVPETYRIHLLLRR